MNIEAFNKDLDQIDWDVKELNVHQYGNNFLDVFNQILNIHAKDKKDTKFITYKKILHQYIHK